MDNPTLQTTKVTLSDNRITDVVMVPLETFKKIERERAELAASLKSQKELVEALEIIREGEEEYLSGKTTTEPLSSIVA